jgi:hypothetical protein
MVALGARDQILVHARIREYTCGADVEVRINRIAFVSYSCRIRVVFVSYSCRIRVVFVSYLYRIPELLRIASAHGLMRGRQGLLNAVRHDSKLWYIW